MGKNNRRRNNRDDVSKGDASISSANDDSKTANAATLAPPSASLVHGSTEYQKQSSIRQLTGSSNRRSSGKSKSFYQWCVQEQQGIFWVWGCLLLGGVFGFGVGSGWLMGEFGKPPSTWRINLGGKIRSNFFYRHTIGKIPIGPKIPSIDRDDGVSAFWENEPIKSVVDITSNIFGSIPLFSTNHNEVARTADPFSPDGGGAPPVVVRKVASSELKSNPSHPYVYAVLREAIAREKDGYVHPDLGIMEPAPSGAARGIGMVRNHYHKCQTRCVPGLAQEKLQAKREREDLTFLLEPKQDRRYMQEEVLIRVPLSFQMTRKVALDTLLPRITSETQRKTVHELDDAALLVLLLAHERGVGQYSRWLPYIASLPLEPSCGYSQKHRPYILDSINALRDEVGMEVDGWPGELIRAAEYSERIVSQLASDYGSFIHSPKGITAKANIRWALCQVASRATGGSQKHGALRMIPLMDMLNHDAHAGGFVELTGEERLENGDFVDAINEETDTGTFVIRSLRHGRRKALRVGQELMVNYNVPHYSALDWMVSSGFVPPERYQNWLKLDAPLPRIRRDGPFASMHARGDDKNNRQESNFFGFSGSSP